MTYKYWETCAEREREAQPIPDTCREDSVLAVAGDTPATEGQITDRDLSAAEVQLPSDTPDAGEMQASSDETAVEETRIFDIQEIRRDREDNDRMNREVEEYFAEEERQYASGDGETKKKSVARLIFVDGLLGIPLLVISYIVTAAFLLAFAVLTAAFFAAGLALLMGAVTVICNSFRIFSVNVPTALVCIGASIAAAGIGLMMFLLCLLTARKLIPFTVKLPVRLEKKLRLFKD
jgi:uncharacterized membrane protein